MIKPIKSILPLLAISALTACVSTSWNATNHYDDFTDTKTCRVERGTQAGRDFARGFTDIYFTQHFYAENHNGEVRAGVRTEPPLPIGGDIQIKVGTKLYTLTSQNTPIDVAPSVPMNTDMAEKYMGKGYADSIKTMTEDIQKLNSPYRAYTGKKAKALLRDIASTYSEIKFRVIGVNQVTSGTGSFTVDESFTEALTKCDISL
ncbi:MAG: hypothetical protein ACRBB3_07810 [Alphaproteobacteria bacterium]